VSLQAAINYAQGVTREHSSTFFFGSKFFGRNTRIAIQIIYAACRRGDDSVDEACNRDDAKSRLALWWQVINQAYGDERCLEDPLAVGLRWVVERFPIPFSAFEELHLGLLSDISFKQFKSCDELMVYCRRVAGVIGLLVTPITGYRGGPETLDYAVALGNAMQLTNILRDVGEDLNNGRCYLPDELLEKYDVSVDDLSQGRATKGYFALLEELIGKAKGLYRIGWKGIPRLHGSAGIAVGIAALSYEGILTKLENNQYNNLTQRAHLKPVERVSVIPRVLLEIFVRTRAS